MIGIQVAHLLLLATCITDPPSIFEGFLPSAIPTKLPPLRTTSRTSLESRNFIEDQMKEFQQNDTFTFEQLQNHLFVNVRQLSAPVNAFMVDDDSKLFTTAKNST